LALALLVGSVGSAFGAWLADGSGTATTSAGDLAQGEQPTAGITARTDTQPYAQVSVAWNRTANATSYQVERHDLEGVAVPATSDCDVVANPGAGHVTCVEQQTPEGSWLYRQRPRAGANWVGAWSAPSTQIDVAPAAPSNVNATAVSQTQINVSWQDNSQIADRFLVERSSDGSSWSTITTTTATSYEDASVSCGQQRYYRIRSRAHDLDLTSPASGSASSTTPACGPVHMSLQSAQVTGTGNSRTFTVAVRDGSGAPVQGATVATRIEQRRLAGDAIIETLTPSCETGSSGTCTVTFDRADPTANPQQRGNRYEVWVTDVTKPGAEYRPNQNAAGISFPISGSW
jgi:hypothetical protein